MVGNGPRKVKRLGESRPLRSPVLASGRAERESGEDKQMVEIRIKPHLQQAEEAARRAGQRRVYRRNQVFGLLMVAAAIVVWWLFHTNCAWIFPPGWWRL